MSTHTFVVHPDNSRMRLDVFLTANLPDVSRNFVRGLIDNGRVSVNGLPKKPNYRLEAGDEVAADVVHPRRQNILPEDIPLSIVYEDKDLVVVNKPSGMMVHPVGGVVTGTLVNALLHHCGTLSDINTYERPGIVHRLDRETSGVMVAVKNNKAHNFLARQFAKHTVKKEYAALVEGILEHDEGLIDAPLKRHPIHREKRAVSFSEKAKEARTIYKVLKRFSRTCLVALYPETGRTHQLRVHLRHIGHPILGDNKYGHQNFFSRLALHARALGFLHPETKTEIEFVVRLPKEFYNYFKEHKERVLLREDF